MSLSMGSELMKLNEEVIVSGKGFYGTVCIEETGIIYDYESTVGHSVSVEFRDGTIDAFQKDSVRYYDYR
jgi:hypothetical protein